MAKVCWEELKEWEKTGKKDQSEKRREGNFLGKGEMKLEKVEKRREGKGGWFNKVLKRDNEDQRKER